MIRTLPFGIKVAVWPYRPELIVFGLSDRERPVAGSKISAVLLTPVGLLLPPVMRIVPSPSKLAVWEKRSDVIDPVDVKDGVVADILNADIPAKRAMTARKAITL